ncbi:MAG: 5'-methylthioadenosine nucleosidase [Gammaproteobacteria bacterium]|nr:5'-methylthioadenosine nucleosidase [Gammaproteobacteria bacterium]
MSRLGVVAALPAEGRALTGRLQPAGTVSDSTPGLLVSISGIGPSAAADAARQLVSRGASALVSWGCGAGLTDRSQPGQLFLPQTIIDQAGQKNFTVDESWHAQLGQVLHSNGLAFESGSLVSVTAMLTSSDAKRRLLLETGAAIADMESAAVAAVAREHDRPYLCVRTVVDNLAIMLPPEILPMLDAYGRPRTINLLGILLRRPALIPPIIRLGRAFSQAQKSLAAVAGITGRKLACGS